MINLVEEKKEPIAALCRKYGVKRLELFGSATSDRFNPDSSDLDFLVEFEDFTVENAADRYLGLLVDLEDLFGRKIDLVCDSSIRNPYFKRVVEQTRVGLYAA